MSFLTQRIANRYPHWAKIRKDPSSLGQRLLSPIAETMEMLQINQLRMDGELHLLKHWTGLGSLWIVDLDEADYYRKVRSTSGGTTWSYPTVTGNGVTLPMYETFEELAYGVPSRIEALETVAATTNLVWSSASPFVFNTLPDSQRLWVSITDSDEWYSKTTTRNRLFGGSTFVRIIGIDINDLDLIEVISPKDDGLHLCSHFFKEVTGVEYGGFDGDVQVYWSSAGQATLTDPHRVVVFEDFEAPLLYSLSAAEVDSVPYSLLNFSGARYKEGYEYRRPNVEDLDNIELLGDTVLTDDTGAAFTSAGFAISNFHGLLFVLDTTGVVHVFDPALPEFGASQLTTKASLDSYMRIDPLKPYATFGATERLFTSLHRPRYPITSVVVKRRSPSGAITYLQGDKTWGVSSYEHRQEHTLNVLNWQELSFSTMYDEVGQWEYWLTCNTEKDATISYSAVVVGTLEALVSFDTEVVGANSISFGRRDEMQIGNGTNVYRFTLHKDGFIAQEDRQQIILREEYDAIGVTY